MKTYTVELYGNFSLDTNVTAASEEEAIVIAATQVSSQNPDLQFDISEVEIHQQETYTSLAQHYSQPQQQEEPRQPYVPMRALASNNVNYTPYSG